MESELNMTLINLRKWLPIYKTAKIQIDVDKKIGNSWMKAYEHFDTLLWGAFEGIIHLAWYEGCVEDCKVVLRATTHYYNMQYKEEQ